MKPTIIHTICLLIVSSAACVLANPNLGNIANGHNHNKGEYWQAGGYGHGHGNYNKINQYMPINEIRELHEKLNTFKRFDQEEYNKKTPSYVYGQEKYELSKLNGREEYRNVPPSMYRRDVYEQPTGMYVQVENQRPSYQVVEDRPKGYNPYGQIEYRVQTSLSNQVHEEPNSYKSYEEYQKPGQEEYKKPIYRKEENQKPIYCQKKYKKQSRYSQEQYEKPRYEKKEYKETYYGQDDYEKPIYDQEEYTRPSYSQEEYEKPRYVKKEYKRTKYVKEPSYDQEEYVKPSYEKKEYKREPVYDEEVYEYRKSYRPNKYKKCSQEKYFSKAKPLLWEMNLNLQLTGFDTSY